MQEELFFLPKANYFKNNNKKAQLGVAWAKGSGDKSQKSKSILFSYSKQYKIVEL